MSQDLQNRREYQKQYHQRYKAGYRARNKTIQSVYPEPVFNRIQAMAERLGLTPSRFQRNFLLTHLHRFEQFESMVTLRDLARSFVRQVEPAMTNINQITKKFHEFANYAPGDEIAAEALRAYKQIHEQQKQLFDLAYKLERAVPTEAWLSKPSHINDDSSES